VGRALGIPYARAARFELPEPVAYDASDRFDRFGPAAAQPPAGDDVPGMAIGETAEADGVPGCLTLNVWAPEGASGLPVMVWFHGGAFSYGASSQPTYDGARLASEQQVVVVSANYRLGPFGFLDTRAIGGDTANLGLHDARAALAWVRAHIAEFGGDAGNVTTFGESAGGGVVAHLLGAPGGPPFHRAIVQSGFTDKTLDPERAAIAARAVCERVGAHDLASLRRVPAGAIVTATEQLMAELLEPVGRMPFHPCVDGDLVRDAPAAALAAGAAADVALLAGTTGDEMAHYVREWPAPPDRARLVRRVGRYAGIDGDAASALVAAYEADLGPADPGAVWAAVFSDVEMQLPLRRALAAHAAQGPTYTYLFAWSAPERGAFHAIDLPFTFDAFDVDGWAEYVGADASAYAVGRVLRDAWASFARTGKPGWDAYPASMVLARDSYVAPEHPLFGRFS
jgi:para-nitrobenzyl esterase